MHVRSAGFGDAVQAISKVPESASFQVSPALDASGERMVWRVAAESRELGRFPTAEAALRAAMAYARDALRKGEASSATVTRTRPDGTPVQVTLTAFPGGDSR